MSTPVIGTPPSAVDDGLFAGASGSAITLTTPAMITAMLESGAGISDLILSPLRPPQVEKHGSLTAVQIADIAQLVPADTARLSRDLIGANEQALGALRDQGACDFSYSLPER